ncbi:hypothetical protein M0805_001030 [Coniferiporia weirii]|nr:hypothetical protein M0805_001030 [Coniferiporia weirii]
MSSADAFYTAPPPVNPRAAAPPLSVSLPQQHQFQARLPAMHVPQRAPDPEQIYYSPTTQSASAQPPPLTPASATSTSTFMLPRTAAHQYSAAPASSAPPPSVYESSHQHQHQQPIDAAAYQQHAPAYYAQAASPITHSPVAQGQSHSPVYSHHAAAPYSHPHSQYTPPSSHAAHPPHLPQPQSDPADNAVRHTTATIGSYLTFGTGPFARRTVRAEITEVQKADLGRKCADPPTASSSSGAVSVSDRDRDRDRDRDGASGSGGRDRDGDRDEAPVRNVRKDRRPLDPPPVVALRFFESIHHGTDREYEREIPSEEIEIGGLICQVELFRVTIPPSPAELAGMGLGLGLGLPHALPPNAGVGVGSNLGSSSNVPLMQQGSGAYPQQTQGQGALYTHPFPAPPPPAQPQQYQVYQPYGNPTHGYAHAEDSSRRTGRRAMLALETLAPGRPDDDDSAQSRQQVTPISPVNPIGTSHATHLPPPRHTHAHGRHEEAGWESASPVSPMSPYAYSSHASAPSQAHPLSAPIDVDALPPPREEDKLEYVLFGEHHSHAASILDMAGKSVIYFVFSDLSVKLEGLFRPRYRFFDLFSRTENCADVPVLAQCFGGAFAVYSTKEFPGLKASTQLTKHLSRWGIRVNIRETERKRRGGPGGGGEDSRASGGGGGRRGAGKKGRTSGTGVRRSSEEDEEDADVHRSTSNAVDAPRRYLEGTASGGRARGKGRGRSNHRREGSGGSDGASAGARGRGRPE